MQLPKLETVKLKVQESILEIVLSRPEVMNSFNDQMGKELLSALQLGKKENEIRTIIITGEGKAFCAGEDLKSLTQTQAPLGNILRNRYNPMITLMREIEKPIIAKVNGVAAGAGVSLAMASDFRIAAEHAKFIMAFIKVGLVPDSGAHWFLPKMIGMARAFEWMATGDTIDAKKALEWGIVNQVVPYEQLDETVLKWAKAFASGPTKAYGYIKRGLMKALDSNLHETLEYEAYLQELAGNTEDHKNAVNAFIEKREPTFQGN
ncbi:MAG: enoyl-CoA hydratase-related protein [bacterium]|nr:enoyl-CoA hydratase-related protein [bacterium]